MNCGLQPIVFSFLVVNNFLMSLKKIFLLGLSIRFIVALLSYQITNFDVESYLKIGRHILNRENIYPHVAQIHHPYFPLFLYIEAIAVYLNNFHINPILFIKIVNIFFDLGNIYLVYLLSKQNLNSGLLYALNPITTLISSFHGQFDTIPLFFLLLAIYLFKKNKTIFAFLTYSVAVGIKTWPIMFISPFIKRLKEKKILLILIIPIVPFLSIIIYYLKFKNNPIDIFFTIVKYHSLFGFFGIGKAISLIFVFFNLNLTIFLQKILLITFFMIFMVSSILIRKKKIEKEILMLMLIFYIGTTNFAIQYLSWIVPFLILIRSKLWHILIFLMSIFLIINYSSWVFINPEPIATIVGIFLWGSFIFSYIILRKKY